MKPHSNSTKVRPPTARRQTRHSAAKPSVAKSKPTAARSTAQPQAPARSIHIALVSVPGDQSPNGLQQFQWQDGTGNAISGVFSDLQTALSYPQFNQDKLPQLQS